MYRNETESGFALLIALLVVGVVISVGLSILDLSIKQVQLSSNAKESELAFHAANAGMECARYWRRDQSDQIETGQSIAPECFGSDAIPSNVPGQSITCSSGNCDGEIFQYEYDFTWGTGSEERCTRINMVVATAEPDGGGVTIAGMTNLIEGYPGGSNKVCEAGSRCSTISVQGYNLPCSNTNGYGVVQREVLLEF